MCGRLSVGKGFLDVAALWSVRPCVRPVGAARMAAGHNAFRGAGSRPKARALRRYGANGFSRLPVSTGCRITSRLPFPISSVFSPMRLLLPRPRLPVALTCGHDGPDHPRRLVGERDGGDLGGPTREELHEPWSPGSVPLCISNDSQRSDDQHLPQVAIALLRDPSQSLLAAAGVLSRHQPDPCRQVPARLEAFGSGTVATRALARTGPTPGTSISRRPTSVARALALTRGPARGSGRSQCAVGPRASRRQSRTSSGKVFSFAIGNDGDELREAIAADRRHHPNSPSARGSRSRSECADASASAERDGAT